MIEWIPTSEKREHSPEKTTLVPSPSSQHPSASTSDHITHDYQQSRQKFLYLESLPPEVRLNIFSFLDQRSRANIAPISRLYNHEAGAKSPLGIEYAFRRYTERIAENSHRSKVLKVYNQIIKLLPNDEPLTSLWMKKLQNSTRKYLRRTVFNDYNDRDTRFCWYRLPITNFGGKKSTIEGRLLEYFAKSDETAVFSPLQIADQWEAATTILESESRSFLFEVLVPQCPKEYRTKIRSAAIAMPDGAGAEPLKRLALSTQDPDECAKLREEACIAAIAMPDGTGMEVLQELALSAKEPIERAKLRTIALTMPNEAGLVMLQWLTI